MFQQIRSSFAARNWTSSFVNARLDSISNSLISGLRNNQFALPLQQQQQKSNLFLNNTTINYGVRCITFSTTKPLCMPLEEFRDPINRNIRETDKVGRSWSVRELRIKSYEDLQKLWLVLYKERNMLLTEQQLSRRRQIEFPQPERILKVRKSMGAIKHVLGERKRDHLSIIALRRLKQSEKRMGSYAYTMDDMDKTGTPPPNDDATNEVVDDDEDDTVENETEKDEKPIVR